MDFLWKFRCNPIVARLRAEFTVDNNRPRTPVTATTSPGAADVQPILDAEELTDDARSILEDLRAIDGDRALLSEWVAEHPA